ncbi:major facilitator superfamily domain-containing protein [Chytriomyces sp. MP71]|nr:major facilitator superfamily domain-containing protein [Chytriomyces sp. MP71]
MGHPHPSHALVAHLLKVTSVAAGAVSFQQLLIIIVCHSDRDWNTPYEACAADAHVQAHAASWLLRMNLAEQVSSLLVLTVAGAFVDRVGRRSALVLSALATCLEATIFLKCAVMENEGESAVPLSLVVAANFVMGLFGTIAVNRMACSAYIAHSCAIEMRTKYFMLLDASQAVALILGPFFGGYITDQYGYMATFSIMLCISAVLLLYLILVCPESVDSQSIGSSASSHQDTTDNFREAQHDSISSPLAVQVNAEPQTLFLALQDSVSSTWTSLRLIFRYTNSATLLCIMTIYAFIFQTAQVFFVFYPSKMFGWGSLEFGEYAMVSSFLDTSWLTLALWFHNSLRRTLRSRADLSPAQRGAKTALWEIRALRVSLAVATLGWTLFGLAPDSRGFVLATLVASAASFGSPTIRSLLSTLVAPSHQGRLFGGVQIFESVCCTVALAGFSLLYQVTVEGGWPQAIFYVMAALLGCSFVAAVLVVGKEGVVKMGFATRRAARTEAGDTVFSGDGNEEDVFVAPDERTPLV